MTFSVNVDNGQRKFSLNLTVSDSKGTLTFGIPKIVAMGALIIKQPIVLVTLNYYNYYYQVYYTIGVQISICGFICCLHLC